MGQEVSKPVAIVTGGAGGIGLATAELLSNSGYQVVTCDLAPLPEEAKVNSCWEHHFEIDVRLIDTIARVVEAASKLGTIHALVNNAGLGMAKPVSEVSEEDWDTILDVHLKAAFFATQYALPHMKKGGGGSIVNVASNAGLLPRAHDPVYSTSKMALVGMTQSLALSLSSDNIRVNSVNPGPVSETGMVNYEINRSKDKEAAVKRVISASPLAAHQGRMVTPEEVAQSIAYLLSDVSTMITGTHIAIDGGKSLGVPPANSWITD